MSCEGQGLRDALPLGEDGEEMLLSIRGVLPSSDEANAHGLQSFVARESDGDGGGGAGGDAELYLLSMADSLGRGVKEFDREASPLLLLRLVAYLGDEGSEGGWGGC